MPGLDHFSSSAAVEDESEEISARNARYGMFLFLVYLVVYCVYVGLNAFNPAAMDAEPLWGVNLAVLYGFALIALALILALIYAWLCRAANSKPSTISDQEKSV